MRNYFHIEVLTPLHVGSGRTLGHNTEFLKFDDVVSVIDDHKVLKIIGEENIQKWVDLIGNGGDLLAYLRQRSPAGQLDPNQTDQRLLPVVGTYLKPENGLREQIFSGNGRPLLPGSSLKGAIRTAIINALIEKQPYVAEKALKSKSRKPKKDGYSVKYDPFEKQLVGKDPNHDSFRLLRIGDAHFNGTVCLLAQTLNQTSRDLEIKEKVNQLVECIPAGAEALSGVSIPEDLLREINKRPTTVACKMKANDAVKNWVTVFDQINDFTKKRIDAELEKYDTALPAADYPETLEELRDQMNRLTAYECIVRVGFGTGYLNMTGGWPEEQWQKTLTPEKYREEMGDLAIAVRRNAKYNDFALPKSRKIIAGGVPMGYLKLTLWSAEQAEAWRGKAAQRQLQLEAEQAQVAVAARQQAEAAADAARLQAEAEAEAIRRLKEEARKPQPFTGTIRQHAEMDAEVVGFDKKSNRNLVKLFIERQEYEALPMIYATSIEIGTAVIVKVNEFDKKKGRVRDVRLIKFK